jgi:hypothetical protein
MKYFEKTALNAAQKFILNLDEAGARRVLDKLENHPAIQNFIQKYPRYIKKSTSLNTADLKREIGSRIGVIDSVRAREYHLNNGKKKIRESMFIPDFDGLKLFRKQEKAEALANTSIVSNPRRLVGGLEASPNNKAYRSFSVGSGSKFVTPHPEIAADYAGELPYSNEAALARSLGFKGHPGLITEYPIEDLQFAASDKKGVPV